MNIWRPESVSEAPEVILSHWEVVELPDGDRHFIGYNTLKLEGRVSSKIVDYNKDSKIGTTRSGRTYKLTGCCTERNDDAEYVWGIWKQLNKITEYKIVSKEYL